MTSPSRKRRAGPELVSNPFVKKQNLGWSISPPPFRDPDRRHHVAGGQGPKASVLDQEDVAQTSTEQGSKDVPQNSLAQDSEKALGHAALHDTQEPQDGPSGSALIENNTVKINDHLAWFSDLLAKATLQPFPQGQPHLSIHAYRSLYNRSSQSAVGAHFVVTQHDHPVAGPHYDLRLQINGDSSCSWAIMYGFVLPMFPSQFYSAGHLRSVLVCHHTPCFPDRRLVRIIYCLKVIPQEWSGSN